MADHFQDQPHARARGKVGEDDAVRWLADQGYEILARNVVNHGGEIDVVAKDGATLCFVEIKAR
ncbi:MAG TPA: YraN family protein, partial [Thermoanaerobaculia bacterium]